MADPIDDFVKRLKLSADKARLSKREPKSIALSRPRKPQRQIPISLFHDMFGEDVRSSGLIPRVTR